MFFNGSAGVGINAQAGSERQTALMVALSGWEKKQYFSAY